MVHGKYNQPRQKMTVCSEQEELRRVTNVLHNWVLDRNGAQFTMNDIYRDPAIRSELSASIGTMIFIDRALINLGCVAVNGGESISLQQSAYKPPNVRFIDRDLLCT